METDDGVGIVSTRNAVRALGRPAPLQLHHVNGDGRDNRHENLEILCPNYHSQTDSGRDASAPKATVRSPSLHM